MFYEVKIDTNTVRSFSGIDYSFINGDYLNEKINLIRFNYSNSKTYKHTNYNTRFSVYGGVYTVSGLGPYDGANYTGINYNGNKSAFGASFSYLGGINFNIKDFRIGLGIEPTVLLEFGEFNEFRLDAADKGIIANDDGFVNVLFSVFPFCSYYFDESKVLALQMNIGYPGGITPSISYQTGENVFWISYLPGYRISTGYSIDFQKLVNQFR